MYEAFDVFRDTAINADCVSVENATPRAQDATKLLTHQPGLNLDV